MAGECEFLITGGEVIDGGGGPRRAADIAVTDGRIVELGNLGDWQADERIDASGLIAAPGFIDAHTHDDRLLLSDPNMSPKVSQGVTTVVVGNCGVSLAPLVPEGAPPPPLNLLGGQGDFRFPSFAAYTETLEETSPAVNAVMLVGHSSLRAAVMDDLDRPATGDEISAMIALADEAMAAGCTGLSTGLAYPTAAEAPTEEVIAVASEVAARGGLYATHMRDEGDEIMASLEETARIGREAGAAVVVSHHKCSGVTNWGRSPETLEFIARIQQGMTFDFDVYPYAASSTVLLESFVERSEEVLITWSEPHPEMSGRKLDAVKEEWGTAVTETIDKLSPAGAVYFQMDEADVRRILAYPDAMVGSDGLPHDERPHPRLGEPFPAFSDITRGTRGCSGSRKLFGE